MSKTILLIEDDPFIARSIKQILPPEYRLDVRKDLKTSYSYLSETRPAAIVLDRTLPDGDGLELAEHIAKTDATSPMLVISGKTMVQDRIEGLRKGADDYLTKPFSTTELLLRLEKMLRTTKQLPDQTITVGELTLMTDRGQVVAGKHLLRMRKREFEILLYLSEHVGRVVSRNQLIDHVWPEGFTPSYSTIDVYIRRLRMILGDYREYIQTVKGFGYLLKLPTTPPVIAGQNLKPTALVL